MQRLITYGSLCALLLAASEARPCGGAFGATVTLDPVQQIVVGYHDGIETYVFNPYFCGKSDTFGLILPVPAPLTQNPSLAQSALYSGLAKIAAPTYVDSTQCFRGVGGSASLGSGGTKGTSNGTIVIQRGQVGIFDWALLKATSAAAFTDWLTANGFPYQPSAQTAFSAYVNGGWYFVAFKVTASGGTGTGGASSTAATTVAPNTQICGNLGPIGLAFPSATQPVVPARIAAVSSNQLTWTLFTLASQQLKPRDYPSTLRFSGAVSDTDMNTYPELASVAQSGDRLTELMMSLTASTTNDIELIPDPAQADYRRTETRIVYVNCTGGAPNTGGATSTYAGGGMSSAGGRGGTAFGGSASTVVALGGAPLGGAYSIDIPTGGTVATGGVNAAATGGSLDSGGSTVAPSTPSAGAKPTGGTTAEGGSSAVAAAATGGVVASNSAGHEGTPAESGCSIAAPAAHEKSSLPVAVLALLAFARRRKKA